MRGRRLDLALGAVPVAADGVLELVPARAGIPPFEVLTELRLDRIPIAPAVTLVGRDLRRELVRVRGAAGRRALGGDLLDVDVGAADRVTHGLGALVGFL